MEPPIFQIYSCNKISPVQSWFLPLKEKHQTINTALISGTSQSPKNTPPYPCSFCACVCVVPLPDPETLQELEINIIDQSVCNSVYPELTSDMICAGDQAGGKDACKVSFFYYLSHLEYDITSLSGWQSP